MSYDLNDLQSDINHAYHLIDITVGLVQEGPAEDDRLHRISALTWVLRDMLDGARKQLDERFAEIGSTCRNWPGSDTSPIMTRFHDWCVLRAQAHAGGVDETAMDDLTTRMDEIMLEIAQAEPATVKEMAAQIVAITDYDDGQIARSEVGKAGEACRLVLDRTIALVGGKPRMST